MKCLVKGEPPPFSYFLEGWQPLQESPGAAASTTLFLQLAVFQLTVTFLLVPLSMAVGSPFRLIFLPSQILLLAHP